MLGRGIPGSGRTRGVSFRPFPNPSCWRWLISSVFLIKISCHKTVHANSYYGAWPEWVFSISVLPLTELSQKSQIYSLNQSHQMPPDSSQPTSSFPRQQPPTRAHRRSSPFLIVKLPTLCPLLHLCKLTDGFWLSHCSKLCWFSFGQSSFISTIRFISYYHPAKQTYLCPFYRWGKLMLRKAKYIARLRSTLRRK